MLTSNTDYKFAGDLYKKINGQRGIQLPEEQVGMYISIFKCSPKLFLCQQGCFCC